MMLRPLVVFIHFIYFTATAPTAEEKLVFNQEESGVRILPIVRNALAIKDEELREKVIMDMLLHEKELQYQLQKQMIEQQFKANEVRNNLTRTILFLTKDKDWAFEELWLGVGRSIIEFFEKTYGLEAQIDYASINTTNPYVRTEKIRIMRWKWIFENKDDDYIVKEIIAILKTRKAYPKNADEFADCIAKAYSELSAQLHSLLLFHAKGRPIGAVPSTRLVLDPSADEALSIVLRLYNLDKITLKNKLLYHKN